MEVLLKLIKRIHSLVKLVLWKIVYWSKFKTGINTVFYPLTHLVIDGGEVSVGKKCFFNRNCSINSRKRITIGDNVIFGENVCLYDHNHQYRNKEVLIRKQAFKDKEIVIGSNCWIGSNVTILAGATIGNNVVIGAGCVVKGNIPDNMILKNGENYILEEY